MKTKTNVKAGFIMEDREGSTPDRDPMKRLLDDLRTTR